MWSEFLAHFQACTYEEVTHALRQKRHVQAAERVLQHYHLPPAHARVLLSAFLLTEHASDTFGTRERTTREQQLEACAYRVLKQLETESMAHDVAAQNRSSSASSSDDELPYIEECRARFQARFQAYHAAFVAWKEENKHVLFLMLATTYRGHQGMLQELMRHETSATSSDGPDRDATKATTTPHTNAAVDQVRRSMQDLERRANQLGYSVEELRDVQDVDRSSSTPTAPDDTMMGIARRAFWDAFREKLDARDFSHLRVVLDEIRERLQALTPRRADLHRELDDAIDSALILPQIEAGSYSPEQFHVLVAFIVGRIAALEAPADSAATQQWQQQFLEQCAAGKAYRELLPTFFAWVYERLEAIEEGVRAFRAQVADDDDDA